MQFQSLGQIIADVIHTRAWLGEIGISTTGTRLEKIQDHLVELLNPTTPSVSPLAVNANEEDTYYALSDGASFGRIAAEMRKLSPHLLPRRTLQDILKGPLVPSQEKPGSTATPRNKFVELELAAHCSSAGCRLLGFDDLTFEFEGCRYVIECKRPWHKGTLDRNIKNAYRQIQSKLDGSDCRGIVAVAVEKMFGLDNRFQQVDSDDSAFELAHLIGEQFRKELKTYYHRWIDTRVVGVLAIIRFLWKSTTPDTKVASYILCLVKFATPQVAQAAESTRLDRLIETFRRA